MSNATTHRLHGCETICFPIQPTGVLRTELKLNLCTNETSMKPDPLEPGRNCSDQSADEHSPNSEAPSNDPSYQTSSKDYAEVTMCICPVCGFSASSPRGQDEHMETEHGECLMMGSSKSSTVPGDRLSPVPDVFTSTNFGIGASSTPQQRPSQTQEQHQHQQQSLPVVSCSSSVTANVTTTNGLGLPHAISLPHFPYESESGQNQTNAVAISSHLIPDDDTTTDVVSTTEVKSSSDWPRTAIKNRAYRGSLGRTTRTASASKLSNCESSLTNALLLQKVDSRRRYRCNICPATFPWHGDLTEHLRLAHGMQKTRESARSGKAGNFCCNYCKYVAKYQSELRRHMRLHWGVKPFACVFCPYRSAWKGDLKRHMESHHRERFSSESELVEIMSQFKNNAGTTVNGFPLSAKSVPDAYKFGSDYESDNGDDGSFQFQDNHDLSSGEASLSSFPKPLSTTDSIPPSCSNANTLKTESQFENPLVCTICSYKAQNQSKLQNHMAGHMNLKPFKCPICEHRSNYKWDVRKHLRSQHPNQADLSVVVLSGLDKTGETNVTLPCNLSPPESPMSLCIDLASKTPEQQTTLSTIPTSSVIPRSLTRPRSPQTASVECEPDSEVVPIDLSVKDQIIPLCTAFQMPQPGTVSPVDETKFAPVLLRQPIASDTVVIQHTVSSLVDSKPTLINQLSSSVGCLKTSLPLMGDLPAPMVQNSNPVPSHHSSSPVSGTISWTPGMGLDQTELLTSSTNNSNTIGLILNLQQQLLMHGLLPSWPPRTISTMPVTTPTPLALRVSSATSSDSFMPALNLTDSRTDPIDSSRTHLAEATSTSDPLGMREKKTPSEWSSTDTDPSELMHPGRSTFGLNLAEASEGPNEPLKRTRGRKSTACYNRSSGGGGGGGGSGGSIGPKEEQWKRHQCSGCGHRSNWKWDINKHIKVAHPERTNITTVTLDLEEARQTFGEYMNRLKLSRNRYLNDATGGGLGSSTGPGSSWSGGLASTGEGYYRPYKCSVCGHRSNWKWDVRKHIKQMHNSEAEVITLSLDEARRTIHQYKSCRRQQQTRLVETTFKPEPRYESPERRMIFVSQDQNSEMGERSSDKSPNTECRIEPSVVDMRNLTQSSKRDQNSHVVESGKSVGPSDGSGSVGAGAVGSVTKSKSFKMYYPCRQCGRRFRSYQNLFFHLHHKHHAEANDVKSPSLPPLSVRFYYAVSRNSPRVMCLNRLQRMKVLNNENCIPQSSSEDLIPRSKLTSDVSDQQLEVDERSMISTIGPSRKRNSPTNLSTVPSTTDTNASRFLVQNAFQRDRLLRARRRTGTSSLPVASPLRSSVSHDNVNLLTCDTKTDHSGPDECSPQTVRLLTELLDNVLNILEGKPYPVATDSTGSEVSTENCDGEVISHLTDLIQRRLSKNETTISDPLHVALDTSTSSNEENLPLGTDEHVHRTRLDRPIGKILHHPEVEQRFLRLVTLFHSQQRDQSIFPSKRFRPSGSSAHTDT
ncbi:Zinc finger protein 45 [Fasciola gigantica]|uniref:Zinc finger protein 45 n=1 Tax=Fasciola gigantica TaxID=46835 RepID=A0A504ZBW7_FASGI|nr:Zinc finger protein 45 [Fasciola gigantica]